MRGSGPRKEPREGFVALSHKARRALLSFHCFTKYVKMTFFRGTSLRPLPPGASKVEGKRYLDVDEEGLLDEGSRVGWVAQATALPGWTP